MNRTRHTHPYHYIKHLISGLTCFWLILIPFTHLNAQFAGGNGSENNPFLITNVTQLQAIRNASNSAHFRLINDIDALATSGWNGGQGFNPIGQFNGSLDGAGYTVNNLTINRPGLYNCAFITQMGAMAVVQNITFANATVRGGDRTAMFSGTLGGTLSNVTGSGMVIGGSTVGGIAGQMDAGSSVLNSTMTVNVTGTGDWVGGITGLLNSNAILTNVANTGNVSGQARVGGVTGQVNSGAIITNAVITGNVTGTGDLVGGLVGYNQNQIMGSSYTGNVSGQKFVGGAAGRNEGAINGVSINGNITGSSDNIGGLVGWNNNGTITNCATSGSVSGVKEVGGLVGFHGYSNGTISGCNAAMSVTGLENVGGLVGYNQDGLIEKSYTTGQVNGITNTGGLVGNSRWGGALISMCYTLSNVNPGGTGGNSNQSGGLIGNLTGGTVQNCFARGSVTGNNRVGGLIGQMEQNANIMNSYSTGQVVGNAGQVGGLIGRLQSGNVSNSYWDTQLSGQSSSQGGLGRTTAQMLQQTFFQNAGWDFTTIWSMDPAINNGYPYLISIPGAFMFVWTGNIDREWEKTGNWSLNRLPVSTDNIIIPNVSNKPVLSSNATVRGISIQPNSSLTINPAGTLRVLQALSNSAGAMGLVFISNATGTGSLIHPSSNVQATFQRYIPGVPEAWHMLSSPMTAQSIAPEFTPSGTYGDGTGYDLYHWHEPDTGWIYYNHPGVWNSTHGSSQFIPGRGYLVSYQDTNPTRTFKGVLNNDTVTVPVTRMPNTADEAGYNLLGNPYPSSIDWKAQTGWNRSALEQSGGGYNIWIWNDSAKNYGVYHSASINDLGTLGAGRYIAPNQGFFVRAASSGIVSFSNGIRTHQNSGAWLKTSGENDLLFSLSVISDQGFGSDELIIEFGHHDSEGGVPKKFGFSPDAPSVFIPFQQKFYSMRLLSDPISHPVIPVCLQAHKPGFYTLVAAFPPDDFQTIYLEDLKTKWTHDFRMNSRYTFSVEKGDAAERFILRFQEGNFPNPHLALPARLFSVHQTLYADLRLLDQNQIYTLRLFDLSGRLQHAYSMQGGSMITLFLPDLKGIIIAHLVGKDGTLSTKIAL